MFQITGGKQPARSFPPDGTTFSQIILGQKLNNEISPYGYWNMQFYQSESAYIKFDYSIPRGASIAVYIRRNALPTHTQYNILEVLSGFKARQSRASHVSPSRSNKLNYIRLNKPDYVVINFQSLDSFVYSDVSLFTEVLNQLDKVQDVHFYRNKHLEENSQITPSGCKAS